MLRGSLNKINVSRKVVGKRTFHKTGDQLTVQGLDLFQINYRSTCIRTLLKVNDFMSSISTLKKLTFNVLMKDMKLLYKKPSVVYFGVRIHKSNSCFLWNRNNVIRAISNGEVGCNLLQLFADFPLLSRYSGVHQISWPLFLKVSTHEGFCSGSMLQGHALGAKLLRVYQWFHGYTSSSGAEFPPRKMLHDI